MEYEREYDEEQQVQRIEERDVSEGEHEHQCYEQEQDRVQHERPAGIHAQPPLYEAPERIPAQRPDREHESGEELRGFANEERRLVDQRADSAREGPCQDASDETSYRLPIPEQPLTVEEIHSEV